MSSPPVERRVDASAALGVETGPVEAPVPLWLALSGLGAGMGCIGGAALVADPLLSIAMLTGAAALGGLGGFGLCERLVRAYGAAPDAATVFDLCYGAAPEPVALVDATGRIRAMNVAARAAASPHARRASDLIPHVADAEALVTRLLRETVQERPAMEVAPLDASPGAGADAAGEDADPGSGGDAKLEVSAWPVAQGLAAWRWRPVGRAGDSALDRSGAVAWFRADPSGRVIEASRRFREWFDIDDPDALTAADPQGRAEPRATGLGGLDIRGLFPDAGRRLMAEERVHNVSRTRLRATRRGPEAVSLLVAPIGEGGRIGVATPAPRGGETSNVTPVGGAEALVEALDALNSNRLFESSPIGVLVLSLDAKILRVNAAADRFLSVASVAEGETPLGASGALGRSLVDLLAEDDREEAVRRLAAATECDGATPFFEARLARTVDAEPRVAQCYATRVESPKGDFLLCYLIDASERRALEDRFNQTQRLHAVGQLAGGVAHDFNNLLTVIIAASEMLLQRRTEDDPDFGDLDQIYQNAHRAAHLVKQLLAYSRKQTLRPQIVNLTERLSDLSYMLNRLIGEKIVLRQDLSEDLWDAKVDVNQFGQVVTNLVVNARDAMGEAGGRIDLRTRNQTYATARETPHEATPAGDYVCVEVQDNGCGIPKDKLEKIFEPFYTTKGVGEGTGLGLSTVYGIVKQTGGFIFVDSVVNEGTTFRILLPRHVAESAAKPASAAAKARTTAEPRPRSALSDLLSGARPAEITPPRAPAERVPPPTASAAEPVDLSGSATILLVEDEAPVRALTARALEARGYRVLEAECGEDALELLEDDQLHVDLLLSDVVMPNMDGPTLLRSISDRRPHLKTLFMSGYPRDAFSGAFEADLGGRSDYGFLQKPFTLDALALAVKQQVSA